jgi:hypothetical protein
MQRYKEMMTVFDNSEKRNEINNIASALKSNMEYEIGKMYYEIRTEHLIDALILEIAKLKFQMEGNREKYDI